MTARISSTVFPMLGAEPMLGRTFTIGEDAPGQNLVILSYGLWQRRFGTDPGIIGRNLELNRQPYTVIGVMPKAFNFPLRGPQGSEPAELWVPMAFTTTELEGWGELHEPGNSSVAVGTLAPEKPPVSGHSGGHTKNQS